MYWQKMKQWVELVKQLVCDVPDNWWPEYKSRDKHPYAISDVDFTQDNKHKKKPWYKRAIFQFEHEGFAYHLNYEALLEYVNPSTVPSGLCLEKGMPGGTDLPVSTTFQRSIHIMRADSLRIVPLCFI